MYQEIYMQVLGDFLIFLGVYQTEKVSEARTRQTNPFSLLTIFFLTYEKPIFSALIFQTPLKYSCFYTGKISYVLEVSL